MNIISTKLFFRCLYFATCFYYIETAILGAISTAEKNVINEYFYRICHLNRVEHEQFVATLIPKPLSPISSADVKFLFLSRTNPIIPLVFSDDGSFPDVDFSKETVIVCGGYLLPSAILAAIFSLDLLPQIDINMIMVDWDSYIFYNPLYESNVTTPRLGNMIGDFLEKLVKKGLDPKKTTLVGYSVGSQAVGLAAKRIRPKIARIFGFSAYGTCFNFQPDDQRLTIEDTDFLILVHTAAGVFEYHPNQKGHVTFYINGGILQPECAFIPSVLGRNFCSHLFGLLYLYISTQNTNSLEGVKCDTYENYQNNECDCSDTANLIYNIPNSTNGSYYINTNRSEKNLCEPK